MVQIKQLRFKIILLVLCFIIIIISASFSHMSSIEHSFMSHWQTRNKSSLSEKRYDLQYPNKNFSVSDENITFLYNFMVNFTGLPWDLHNYQLRLVFDSRELYNAGYVDSQLSHVFFAIQNGTRLEKIPFIFEGKYGSMVNTISPSENTTVWVRLPYVSPNCTTLIVMYTNQSASTARYSPNDVFDFYTDFSSFENFSSYGNSPSIIDSARTSNGKALSISGWAEIVNTFSSEWTSPILVWESRSDLTGSSEAYMPFIGFSTSSRSGDEDNAYQFGFNVYGSSHCDNIRIFKDGSVVSGWSNSNLPRYDWTITSFRMKKLNASYTDLQQTVSSVDEITDTFSINDTSTWVNHNPIEMGVIVWSSARYSIDWIRVHKYDWDFQTVTALNMVLNRSVILLNDFSYEDIFQTHMWERTDLSVYSNIATGNFHIENDGNYDDFGLLVINVSLPFVFEARSRLVSGGWDYVLPAYHFLNSSGGLEIYIACRSGNGIADWVFDKVYTDIGHGPTGENIWWDIKVVVYKDNQTLYAKPTNSMIWTRIAVSHKTIANITSIKIRQHWDSVDDVDYVKIYTLGIENVFDSDNDGMPNWWEKKYGLDPNNASDASQDADNDGLTNLQEYQYGTNPINPDTDGDGLSDGIEVNLYNTSPIYNDTDGDGLNDKWEIDNNLNATNPDTDGDSINDYEEVFVYHTDPNNPDTDGDGMPDGWEVQYGLNATYAGDAVQDVDNDGITNLQEYQHGTDPTNADTDGDGMPDGWEVQYTLDPLNASDATQDPDGDMLANLQEYQYGTNPLSIDTDDDGMPDNWEIENHLNPIVADANGDIDHDNLTNLQEYVHHTDPNNPDTDGDGMPDGWEVQYELKPMVNDANGDADGDGITNLQEYKRGTDPNNPNTDGDLMPDNFDFIPGWLDDGIITITIVLGVAVLTILYNRRKAIAI